MEKMRYELSLKEQDLQIQEIQCEIAIKQEEIAGINNYDKSYSKDENRLVRELATKSHILVEALADKINFGILKKF